MRTTTHVQANMPSETINLAVEGYTKIHGKSPDSFRALLDHAFSVAYGFFPPQRYTIRGEQAAIKAAAVAAKAAAREVKTAAREAQKAEKEAARGVKTAAREAQKAEKLAAREVKTAAREAQKAEKLAIREAVAAEKLATTRAQTWAASAFLEHLKEPRTAVYRYPGFMLKHTKNQGNRVPYRVFLDNFEAFCTGQFCEAAGINKEDLNAAKPRAIKDILGALGVTCGVVEGTSVVFGMSLRQAGFRFD